MRDRQTVDLEHYDSNPAGSAAAGREEASYAWQRRHRARVSGWIAALATIAGTEPAHAEAVVALLLQPMATAVIDTGTSWQASAQARFESHDAQAAELIIWYRLL